jgi:flagellar assembly protein FliH
MNHSLQRFRIDDESVLIPGPGGPGAPPVPGATLLGASEILAAAHAEAVAIRADAQAAGYHAGQAVARQELHTQAERFVLLADALARERTQALEVAEADLVELVLEATAHLLGEDPALLQQAAACAVRSALDQMPGVRDVHVHLAAADADAVAEIVGASLAGTRVEIARDARLTAGDCRVEGPRGGLDARLGTRLELLRDRLLEDESHAD